MNACLDKSAAHNFWELHRRSITALPGERVKGFLFYFKCLYGQHNSTSGAAVCLVLRVERACAALYGSKNEILPRIFKPKREYGEKYN